MEQWFDNFLGNPPWRWLEAGGVAIAILFVLLLLRRMAYKQYQRFAATPADEFLELVSQLSRGSMEKSPSGVLLPVTGSNLRWLVVKIPQRHLLFASHYPSMMQESNQKWP